MCEKMSLIDFFKQYPDEAAATSKKKETSAQKDKI